MSDTNSEPGEPVRFSGAFTTDPDYARRFTRASLTANLFSRSRLVLRVVAVGVILVVGVGWLVTSPYRWQGILFAACAIVLIAIPYIVVFPITARIMRKHLPVGSNYRLQLCDSTMTVAGPEVTSTVAYSYYQSVERRNSFVLLRQRITRRYVPVPIELFSDESYAFLVSRIQPTKAIAKPDA